MISGRLCVKFYRFACTSMNFQSILDVSQLTARQKLREFMETLRELEGFRKILNIVKEMKKVMKKTQRNCHFFSIIRHYLAVIF